MSKKLMLIVLASMVALGTLFVAACGDDADSGPDPKIAMSNALAVIDADIAALTDQMMAGGNGADVKAALVTVTPDWQAVVDACDGVDGADATKAQEVFDGVSTAVNGLSDDADLNTIAGAVLGPLGELTAYTDELGELVGYEGGTAADTTE